MGNDCALAWPQAEIAVMGAAGAVEIVNRRELLAVPEGPEREARRHELEDDYRARFMSPAIFRNGLSPPSSEPSAIAPRSRRQLWPSAPRSISGPTRSRPRRRKF